MKPLFDIFTERFSQIEDRVPFAPRRASGFMGLFSKNSAETQMDAYGSVGTLFAIVNRLAETAAAVEWRMYRPSVTGNSADRRPVLNHAFLDIWNKPNAFTTGFELREAGFQHLLLTGELPILVVRSRVGGMPLQFWNIRPDRLDPIIHPSKFRIGWWYHSPDGEKIDLSENEIWFTRLPHPKDPYRGMGVVQALLTDLDTAKLSAEWNRNFFVNGAEPGGVIEVEKRLSDRELREMTERWRNQHQGVANAHRVAIIEQGIWKDRKFSNNDMQFVELRGLSRELVREAFSYPKIMLGTVDDVNRANAEVGEEMYGRWLIHPMLRRTKQSAIARVMPSFQTARTLELDYDDPVPESREQATKAMESTAKSANLLVMAGYDGKDVQKGLNLPEMGWEKPKFNDNPNSGASGQFNQ